MKSYLAKSRLVPLVLIFGMILLIFCGVLYKYSDPQRIGL